MPNYLLRGFLREYRHNLLNPGPVPALTILSQHLSDPRLNDSDRESLQAVVNAIWFSHLPFFPLAAFDN